MIRVAVTLTLAASLAPMIAAVAAAETAQELVARSIQYHGGDLYRSTLTTLELCSKSGCSKLDVLRSGTAYEYCAAAPVTGGERRVCATNDQVTEVFSPGEAATGGRSEPSPAPDREQVLRDWVMARVYFAFLPSRLDDPSVRLRDLGTEVWEGRELRKVKVTFEADTSTDAEDEFLYWFDPGTARLELFAYSYERNDGGIRFRRLTNYRRTGGILFFDQENFGVDGPLSVELVSPDYVRHSMRHVSTVELRGIEVETLE